jgi:hypothetical protein
MAKKKGKYWKDKKLLRKVNQATVVINLPPQPKPQPKPAFKEELIGAKNFLFVS